MARHWQCGLAACGIAAGTLGLVAPALARPAEIVAQAAQPIQSPVDLVDTAIAAGQFDTLVAALKAAGLVDTLKGPGPFTVFAPTDAAFKALPPGALDQLLKNPDQLKALLLYHVVAGRVTAAEVVKLTSAKTVQGATVPIRAGGGRVQVGTATVIQADILTTNGVIHVIDAVLIPPKN